MISKLRQDTEEQPEGEPPPADYIATAPRISVQVFCETMATAVVAKAAGE